MHYQDRTDRHDVPYERQSVEQVIDRQLGGMNPTFPIPKSKLIYRSHSVCEEEYGVEEPESAHFISKLPLVICRDVIAKDNIAGREAESDY